MAQRHAPDGGLKFPRRQFHILLQLALTLLLFNMDIFFILALIFTSIVAVTFIVERGMALR